MPISFPSPNLNFPVGRQPGVDYNHLMLSNGGQLRFSAIAAQTGFVTIAPYSNVKPTKSGTITQTLDGAIGYASVTANGGSNRWTFSVGGSATVDSQVTLAAIWRGVGSGAFVSESHFLATSSSTSGGWNFGTTASSGILRLLNGAFTSSVNSTITPQTNTPYFVAVSTTTAAQRWVATNLSTGQILTSSTSTALSASAGNGSYTVMSDGAGGNSFGGNLSCVAVIAGTQAPLSKLLQWAADPWSFWYPPGPDEQLFLDLVGASSAATQALLARGLMQTKSYFGPFSGNTNISGLIATRTKAQDTLTVTRSVFGRMTAEVMSRAQQGAAAALAASVEAQAKARLTQSTGVTGLLARAISQIKSINALTAPAKLFGRATVQIGPGAFQPANFINFTYLFGRASGLAKAFPTLTAQTPLTAALNGFGKIVTMAHALPSVSSALFGRAKGPAIKAFAQAASATSLLAHIVAQGRSLATGSVASKLFTRTVAQAKNQARAIITASLAARATVEIGPQAFQPANYVNFTYLFGRASALVKALPTLTTQAPLSATLIGLGKVMTAARARANVAVALFSGPPLSPALDGISVIAQPGAGTTSYNLGPLTTTYANGEVFIVHDTNAGGFISSISGGGLTFTRRAFTSLGGNNLIFELWAAPVGRSPVNNVTFAITIPSGASGITTALFAVSNYGNPLFFDTGGPQTTGTATNVAATMTTNETAFVICAARFNSTSAPTASSPWTGIVNGISNSFMAVEYQVATANTFTGAFSGTDENGSIIDAVYSSATPTGIVASIMARALMTAQTPLATALNGFGKIVTTARAIPSTRTTLLGRVAIQIKTQSATTVSAILLSHVTTQTKVFARSTVSTTLAAFAKVQTVARIAQPSGTLALLARALSQVKALPTLTAQSPLSAALHGLGTVMTTARAAMSEAASLLGRAKGPAAQAHAQSTVSTALLSRATVQTKAFAQPSITLALIGLGKIVTTTRAAMLSAASLLARATVQIGPQAFQPASYINFTYLFSRTSALAKVLPTLTVQSPLARALTGAIKAMVTARLAQPTGSTALQGRIQAQAKAAPTLTSQAPLTSALTGVAKAAVTAAASLVGYKFLTGRASATTTARLTQASGRTSLLATAAAMAQARLAQASGKTALFGRSAVQTVTQAVPSIAATLFGRAKGPAVQARLASATRTIFLGAQAIVTTTARFTQPTGTVALLGRVATQIKVKPLLFTVGNLLAISPGRAAIMVRAAASPATFRSAVSTVSTIVSTFYSILTAIKAMLPVASTVTTYLAATTVSVAPTYTVTTTVTCFTSQTTVS